MEHSLRKRYVYKLATNMAGFVISMFSAGMVPRGLGPEMYGNFSFLTNFFGEIKGFLDMGVTIGFYNKLSQRQNETTLIAFYFRFIAVSSLLLLGFVLFTHFTPLPGKIWPGQEMKYVYLAAIMTILAWASNGLDNIVDALGLTVYSESLRIAQKVAGVTILAALFLLNNLTLKNYFLYQYFNIILLITMFLLLVGKKRYSLLTNLSLPAGQTKKYAHEFYRFSFPLFIGSCIGLVAGIMDRWLLQRFAGSIQQGFYGLSFNVGTICFIFTSAMTPLLLREYSIAFSQNDKNKIAILFDRYVPMLYSVAAFFSCFIFIQSDAVAYLLGGKKFEAASIPMKIMALYPVHQTYGQLSSSLLITGEKTKLYRNISVAMWLAGLPLTYFLIAPPDKWGIGAGAIGLSIKMVAIQIVAVNIMLFYNTKMIPISFFKYVKLQFVSLAGFFAIGMAVSYSLKLFPWTQSNIILNFILSGFLYTILVLATSSIFPGIFGLRRGDHKFILAKVAAMLQPQRGKDEGLIT
ncbi:MAG: hypothetical protein A2219_00375 [Elusimicrobia bacterium RIFOXYA2_FULL_50_26]|nr:MAG: hypothetical protein A2219_00375 [Elusimicrobia bacterium RIFOXYA2_FULL_50_26]